MGLFATSFSSLALPFAWRTWFVQISLSIITVEDVSKHTDVYNILWVLVFGFATLNILGLVARKFEPERSRLSFGESLAIMVVVVSVVLLGWEMLYYFKVLPIKLKP
jgi:uncharacterized membrane protein